MSEDVWGEMMTFAGRTRQGAAQSFGDQLFVLTKSAFHDNMNAGRDSPLLRVN